MEIVTAYVIGAVLGATGGVVWTRRRPRDVSDTISGPTYDDAWVRAEFVKHAEVIDALQDQVENQTLAIAEGIEKVDRAERRVRAAVTRARSRMEAAGYVDDSIEAEAAELQSRDGAAGYAQEVSSVPEDLDHGYQMDMSVFPGDWS